MPGAPRVFGVGGVCVGDFGASQQRRFANALIERWVMPIRLWARAGGEPRTRLTLFFFFWGGGEWNLTLPQCVRELEEGKRRNASIRGNGNKCRDIPV